MRNVWIRLGRMLWVFLALDSLLLYSLTLGISFQTLQTPSLRLAAGLANQGLSLAFYAGFLFVSMTIVFLVYFIVALLIFLRRPDDGVALFVSIFLLAFGAANAYPQFGEFLQFYQNAPAWYAIPVVIANVCSYPLFALFFAVYPDGRFVPRWMRFFAAYGFLLAGTWSIFPNAFSGSDGALAIFGAASVAVLTGASLYGQLERYRHHSSLLQRQQTKWLVFALAIVLVSTTVQLFAPILLPSKLPTPGISIWGDLAMNALNLSPIVVPIAIGFAILRYRLFEIDLLIRRTLIYSVITALLALIYFSSVAILQNLLSAFSGQRSEIAIILSTLAIAVLFNPLRHRIQDTIDHRFYRRNYDAQKVLAQFGATARDETDLNQLSTRLIEIVDETMQPAQVSMWLREQRKTPLATR